MSRLILTLFFLNFASKISKAHDSSAEILISSLERKLEFKLIEYSSSIAKWLEGINDRNLKNSELGKLIRYEEIKPKIYGIEEARASKKLTMAMLPIIFHVGATTTWMVVTTILAAKSVAIGLILLVFKIAVSSAKIERKLLHGSEGSLCREEQNQNKSATKSEKVASFFTAWKVKNHHEDMSWSPHHDHHGHSDLYHYPPRPDWNDYRSIPMGHELAYGESKNVENIQH